MEKPITMNTALSPISKENWPEKLNKLKNQYPNIQTFRLDFKSGKGDEFIDEVYDKVGRIIGTSKEEFIETVNSL